MFKKVSAAFLAVMICAVMLAGCGKVDSSKAALTVNGETVSSGTASTYIRFQQALSYSQMVGYGLISEGSAYWDSIYDAETSQTYGGVMLDAAKEDITNMMLLRQHAEEYGISLTDEENAAISAAAEKFISDNGSVAKWIGADQASVENMLSLYTYQTKMRAPMIADVDREVSDEEAAQSTIIYFRQTLTVPDGYEGTEEEYKAEVKANMETLLEQAKAKQLDDTAEAETTADDAAAAEETEEAAEAEVTSSDIISNHVSEYSTLATGINESIYVTSYSFGPEDDGALDAAVVSEARKLADGEFCDSVIETDSFDYIIKMEAVSDPDAVEQKKLDIISDRENTAYDELLQSWKDSATVTTEKGWDQIQVTDKENYVVKQ